MRKVKLQMQISVDGFVADQHRKMDAFVSNWDEELMQYVGVLMETVDQIIIGRVLAEGFIPYWKAAAEASDPNDHSREAAGARMLHETPKVVFSKTLKHHNWENTTLNNGDLAEEISRLKKQEGKDIIVYGGAGFVSNMIGEVLIDEYYFLVDPSMLGKGLPVFRDLETCRRLKLVNAIPFTCGIALMHYEQA